LIDVLTRDYAYEPYDPATGVFTALDPFEGTMQRPMSMNGYSWVEGNTPNWTDPTGKNTGTVPLEVCLRDPLFCVWLAKYAPVALTGGAFVLGLLYSLYNSNPTGLTEEERQAFLCSGTSPLNLPDYCNSASTIQPDVTPVAPAPPRTYPDENLGTPDGPPIWQNPDNGNPNPQGPRWSRWLALLAAAAGTVAGYYLLRLLDNATCPAQDPEPRPAETPGSATATSTPTQEPIDRVRHYTSCDSLTVLRASNYNFTIVTGFVDRVYGNGQGIFFTDTLPFREVSGSRYHPLMISASLGIDVEKTECYLDVDKNQLDEYPWFTRMSPTSSGKPEYIYITGPDGATIGHAILSDGTTDSLE